MYGLYLPAFVLGLHAGGCLALRLLGLVDALGGKAPGPLYGLVQLRHIVLHLIQIPAVLQLVDGIVDEGLQITVLILQLLQGLQRILKGLLVDLLLILQSGLLGLGGVNGLLLLRLLLLQILVLFDGVRHFRFDAVEVALPLQKTRQNVLPKVRIAEGIRQGLQLLINFSFLIDILHIADLQGFIARQQLLGAALVFLLLLLL